MSRGCRTSPATRPATASSARGPRSWTNSPHTAVVMPAMSGSGPNDPWNCWPMHHVPETLPGRRVRVIQGRAHRCSQRQVEVDEGRRQGEGRHRRQDQSPLPPQDPWRHQQHEGGDARCQQQRQGVVAQGEPVDHGCRHEPPRAGALDAYFTRLPQAQEHQQHGGQEDVQRMRVGPYAPMPGDGRERERQARHESCGRTTRRHHGPQRQQGGGAGHGQGGQQIRPVGLVAKGLQHHRRQPRQQGVGGVAGGVGDAQHGTDRLHLGGVPEADIRQERPPVDPQRDRQHG